MKEVKINFGDVDLVVRNDMPLARIEIHRDGKTTALNCSNGVMIKFFTDAIQLLMEVRK